MKQWADLVKDPNGGPFAPDPQQQVLTTVKWRFAVIAALCAAFKNADTARNEAYAQTISDPIVATLDPAVMIPNPTNYAGAQAITVAEYNQLEDAERALIPIFTNLLPIIVKAVGVNA